MGSVQEIKDFVSEKARDIWTKTQRPLMLSDITPELRLKGIDYKEIIFPLSLKKFIMQEMDDDVKVVVHPYQRAKVGVIPIGETFEFASSALSLGDLFANSVNDDFGDVVNVAPAPTSRGEYGSGRYIVNKFLDELAKLPKDDIEKVQIPISILIKMMAGR